MSDEHHDDQRRTSTMGRRAGAPGALPLADAVAQSRNPAVADIIGARRARTAAMISSGSIPWR